MLVIKGIEVMVCGAGCWKNEHCAHSLEAIVELKILQKKKKKPKVINVTNHSTNESTLREPRALISE